MDRSHVEANDPRLALNQLRMICLLQDGATKPIIFSGYLILGAAVRRPELEEQIGQ